MGVRGALALIPAIALRHLIKKWTAAVAMIATLAYLLLSGAAVLTQRSFLMVGLALLAVFFAGPHRFVDADPCLGGGRGFTVAA